MENFCLYKSGDQLSIPGMFNFRLPNLKKSRVTTDTLISLKADLSNNPTLTNSKKNMNNTAKKIRGDKTRLREALGQK